MKAVRTFKIIPRLPERIKRLRELSYNLWWCWEHECISLMRRTAPDLWEEFENNPVKTFGLVSQEKLDDLARDDGFIAHFDRVIEKFDRYMKEKKWYEKHYGDRDAVIAYFSAEFGLTESVPIYSGGLGILAGDHLKSASDLGVPLVGMGLLYQRGYFRQYLNYDGRQGERYSVSDFYNMPVEEVKDLEGHDVIVGIDFPGRTVHAKVWSVKIGRIRLYLLDTNIEHNVGADRDITDELYGGDREKRFQQEIVLGIGGVKALEKMGIHPSVYHMNEGHSAFLGIERIRGIMKRKDASFREALEIARAGTIFTTHTPVPAGIDIFPIELVHKYFHEYITGTGVSWDEFLALGLEPFESGQNVFSMALLAFRLSARANGVSKLHGKVTRRMFNNMWPGLPEGEVPIISITNGIHHRSWISQEIEALYYRYIGERWLTNPEDQGIWKEVEGIPDEELWRTHERRRERLVAFARKRLRRQLISRGVPRAEVKKADEVLDPEILTIGFARRFATYKRADLILRNPVRLSDIINNGKTPVQIIFSGKAHPKDIPGKELIRELIHLAEREEFRKRIVFIEDYDINVARYLVQGVDVWLNTPHRLYEASGTSGMKAAANGALNMSILDGWWDEAFIPGIGWAIGKGEEYEDINYQYDVEANAIYDLLEKEIIPLFYGRGPDKLPRGWIRFMKESIKNICPVFNTHRMVFEYTEKFYLKADERFKQLSDNNFEKARDLAAFNGKLKDNWEKIRIEDIRSNINDRIMIGEHIEVAVTVYLDGIGPEDIDVQLYEGMVDNQGMITGGVSTGLDDFREISEKRFEFSGRFCFNYSGLQGFTVRVLPKNSLLENQYAPGLIKWAE